MGAFRLENECQSQVELQQRRRTYLGSLMDNPHMLPEVAVLLPADGTGRSELVVDVVDVSLQVGLQIAAVATLCALEVFNLQYII